MESANPAPTRAKVARRTYLIDRGFQLKYTLIMVVVSAAISLLFGGLMYKAHVEATDLLDLPGRYLDIVKTEDSTLLWLVMAISVIMAIVLGLFGILITHRVAGPIFVFSHYLAVIGEGRYPQLRPLRKGDELKNFYDVLFQAVGNMRARDKADGEVLKAVAEAMEKALAKSPESADLLRPQLEKARAMSQRLLEAAASEEPATPGQKAEAAARSQAA